MQTTTIQPPPKTVEDKELALWMYSVHASLKSLNGRLETLEKNQNKIFSEMDKTK